MGACSTEQLGRQFGDLGPGGPLGKELVDAIAQPLCNNRPTSNSRECGAVCMDDCQFYPLWKAQNQIAQESPVCGIQPFDSLKILRTIGVADLLAYYEERSEFVGSQRWPRSKRRVSVMCPEFQTSPNRRSPEP